MNDEATTHFASIIDNMEFGMNWLREHLGTRALQKSRCSTSDIIHIQKEIGRKRSGTPSVPTKLIYQNMLLGGGG
jgi:hypothetical protein